MSAIHKLDNYKVILWDFDGVILDSMLIREDGFREVLKSFPRNQVDKLIKYHQANGGLSRYVKFRYFYEEILKLENVNSGTIQLDANNFSSVMTKKLVDSKLLIEDSLNYIKLNHKKIEFHIASGSDDKELNYLCDSLKISNYFNSINGSPKSKIDIVTDIINSSKYSPTQVCLIGDSKNDFDAATVNGIDFYGYNNEHLRSMGCGYIDTFQI